MKWKANHLWDQGMAIKNRMKRKQAIKIDILTNILMTAFSHFNYRPEHDKHTHNSSKKRKYITSSRVSD